MDELETLFADGMVHGDVYTSPELFELEMERIFHRNWVYVGHESEIPEPGDFRTRTIGRTPIILTRDQDGVIRVLMNRCRHRGTTVCQLAKGNTKTFRCAYHGWTYDSSGKLVHLVGPEAYGDEFVIDDYGLTPAALVDTYRGFIFASLQPARKTLREHLGRAAGMLDIAVEISPLATLSIDAGATHSRFRGNWKYVGMDGYHPNILHASVWSLNFAKTTRLNRDTMGHSDHGALTRSLDNGHVMLDVFGQRRAQLQGRLERLRATPGGEDYIAAMRRAYGAERGDDLIALNGDPHIGIFPNLQLISGHLRVIRPVAVDETELDFYPIRLGGVSDEINLGRMRSNEFQYGPAGVIASDDAEAFERAQLGLHATNAPWINLRRGIAHERVDGDGSRFGGISDEITQRGQLDAWRDLMLAGAAE